MLGKLQNINFKSFKSWSYDEKLLPINIFFGANGSGKSSLANWIKENNQDSSLLFDTQYVDDKIRTNDQIDGVQVLVGRQIQQDESIEKAKIRISNLEDQIKQETTVQEGNKKKLSDRISAVFEKGKQSFHTKRMEQKRGYREDPVSALSFWFKDIQKDRKGSKSHVKDSKQLEIIQQTLKLQREQLPNQIRHEEIAALSDLENIFQKKITVPQQVTPEILRIWLKAGLELHEKNPNQHVCLFCGNDFDPNQIFQKIQNRLSNEHSKTLDRLSSISKIIDTVEEAATLPGSLLQDNELDLCKRMAASAQSLHEQIRLKEKDTSIILRFDSSFITNVERMNALIGNVRESLEQKIYEAQHQLDNIEKVAKDWIGNELKTDGISESLSVSIKNSRNTVRDLQEKERAERKRIDELQQLNSQLKPFADLVNCIFARAGIQFVLTLSKGSNSYTLVSRNGNGAIKAADLSEGEIRLLGFLHFYYTLFSRYDENDKLLNPSIDTIIIDDPITSLDRENHFYLIDQINRLANEVIEASPKIQIFLFTNSEYDFHDFAYHAGEGVLRSVIYKDPSGNSQIRKISQGELKNYNDYYKSEFQETLKFAEITNSCLAPNQGSPNETGYIQYGNKMRFIFESHARTHYNIGNATEASLKRIKEYYCVPESWTECLQRSINIINALSHGMSWTSTDNERLGVKEIRNAVRCMICVLYQKDKQHVRAMCPAGFQTNQLDEWSEHLVNSKP